MDRKTTIRTWISGILFAAVVVSGIVGCTKKEGGDTQYTIVLYKNSGEVLQSWSHVEDYNTHSGGFLTFTASNGKHFTINGTYIVQSE